MKGMLISVCRQIKIKKMRRTFVGNITMTYPGRDRRGVAIMVRYVVLRKLFV